MTEPIANLLKLWETRPRGIIYLDQLEGNEFATKVLLALKEAIPCIQALAQKPELQGVDLGYAPEEDCPHLAMFDGECTACGKRIKPPKVQEQLREVRRKAAKVKAESDSAPKGAAADGVFVAPIAPIAPIQ